jgi:adenylyl cyclase-associated protein
LKDTGSHINAIWKGIRDIVEIGTKCKKPAEVQSSLMPFLKPVQDSMAKIRQARLDRKFDWHIKAIMEMLASVSWTIMSAPPAPSTFIKDTIGSSDFWANKIRKEYKGKDDAQIAFCDTMKKMIGDLAAYVKEYHLSGLMWNPRGIDIADYKPSDSVPVYSSAPAHAPAKAAKPTGNAADILKELAGKRTGDGSSAATGLKKVGRDQQTWRKEFKGGKPGPGASATVKPSAVKAAQKAVVEKKRKDPVCKFQPVGSKWIVENQTKESNPNGVCTVEVKNPKEQVYMYVTVETVLV